MPKRQLLAVAGSLVLVVCAAPVTATQDAEPLYVCAAPAGTRTLEMGITICDAAPTDALKERMEVNNLQLKAGALVTDVVADSVLQKAGLEADDVIFRVGGVDVDNGVEVTARLSLIEEAADTVVNFLRRGRPYRVKIRRPE